MERIARGVSVCRSIAGRLSSVMLLALSMPSETARAEVFFDYRIGATFTEDADVETSAQGVTLDVSTGFKDSVTGGIRGGYWLEFLPWFGLAADFSYFTPDDAIDVIPIAPLLMLRLPLVTSDEYPHGRFQPFAGVGPGVFITLADDDGTRFSDESVDIGLDVHAGLKFEVTPILAIFAEYRYTSFDAELDDDIFGVPFDLEIPLDSHHIAGGIGFHF